jgi:hypothetical protein
MVIMIINTALTLADPPKNQQETSQEKFASLPVKGSDDDGKGGRRPGQQQATTS